VGRNITRNRKVLAMTLGYLAMAYTLLSDITTIFLTAFISPYMDEDSLSRAFVSTR
jgi:adenylylsulfate kinase-like enzyme